MIFIRGTPLWYTHYHQKDDILKWMNNKSHYHIKEYDGADVGKMITNYQTRNHHSTVIYSGRRNTRLYNLFEGIAAELNGFINFCYTDDPDYDHAHGRGGNHKRQDQIVVHQRSEHVEDVEKNEYEEFVYKGN